MKKQPTLPLKTILPLLTLGKNPPKTEANNLLSALFGGIKAGAADDESIACS
jgi:hypothetical protein